MKKNDIRLIAAVLLIAAILYVINTFVIHQKGSYVVVSVDGMEIGMYSLAEDQETDIGTSNRFRIQNGKAEMIQADCPDQLCVHQKAIDRSKETIVCLPNKVVLEVTGAEDTEFDAITKNQEK